MNKFDGKKVLLIHDSTNANYQQHLIGWIVKQACDDLTIVDISGVDDSTGTDAGWTAIDAAVTDATLDYCVIASSITAAGGDGGSGILNFDTIAKIWGNKFKSSAQGSAVFTGTTQAGAVGTATLAATASLVADYYNVMLFKSTGGTGAANPVKVIFDYAATTQVATIGGANWTSPSNDTTYELYTMDNLFIATDDYGMGDSTAYKYWAKAVTANDAALVWDFIHSDGNDYKASDGVVNMPPVFVHNVSAWKNFVDSGTVTGGASTTLSDTGQFTGKNHAGKYGYIISGTGIGQFFKIASNTDDTLTISWAGYLGLNSHRSTFITNPAAGAVYRVVAGEGEIFKDVYTQLGIKVLLYSLTDSHAAYLVGKLLDSTGKMKNGDLLLSGEAPTQELEYLGDFKDFYYGKTSDLNDKDYLTIADAGLAAWIAILKSVALA